jgi:glycosyltransferase involved in cell wall biosynthesis
VRICLVYDCLFPFTVGGGERWYRSLARELVAAGHDVTYLTRRQWEPGEEPQIEGVRVVAVSPGGPLYTDDGRRRIGPPLRFGLGVLRHLAANRRSYDVVHSCAFPFFSLLAARLALVRTPTLVAIDWFEVWSLSYWRSYLGGAGGLVGWLVQRACVRLTPRAFVFSRLHARRLRDEGLRGDPVALAGLYEGALDLHADPSTRGVPTVLFAGRHIAEKRVPLVAPAVAAARTAIPGLRGLILGDGPERERVLQSIADSGVGQAVEAPGFVATERVADEMEQALCLLLPSAREGYGLVVIEAAAAGTPSVVVAGPDNAATELIEEGVNGFVAAEPTPEALGAALVRVYEGGEALRRSTAEWFEQNAHRLSAASSAQTVARIYAGAQLQPAVSASSAE